VSRRVYLTAIAIAASTLGCQLPLEYQALTSPPPLTQADLEEDDTGNVSVTLSKGIALAFSCSDPSTGDACADLSATVLDPSIASVMNGYLDADGSGESQAALVIVGLLPGDTTLNVSSTSGETPISVTIVNP
jgi:hypothetical protein